MTSPSIEVSRNSSKSVSTKKPQKLLYSDPQRSFKQINSDLLPRLIKKIEKFAAESL